MSDLDITTLTETVLASLGERVTPRTRQLVVALVRHLHAFAREVALTEAEWFAAIDFLTRTGKHCSDTRQEFILLSDVLGLSSAVIALNHPVATGSLASSVLGPFYLPDAPEVPLGGNLAEGVPGTPTLYRGQITDTAGQPLAGALLDIWSSDGEGWYDVQKPGPLQPSARGRVRADAAGRYAFWSVKPADYPVPTDGPAGELLRAMDREPMRPGHLHFIVSAPGCASVTTQIFASDSPWLHRDAVFGVSDSLVARFEPHAPGTAPDGRLLQVPFCTADFDLRLRRD